MSYSVKTYNEKMKLPKSDLVFEEVKPLLNVIPNLSPKIEGKWEIQIINPTIKESKDLLSSDVVPEWVSVILYLPQKKMEQVCLEFPEYQPKTVPFKEQVKEVMLMVTHVVDKKAFDLLVNAFRGNIADLQQTLLELDKECTTGKITVHDVQAKVNYTKPTYASEVIDSFLLHEKQRWKLLDKLVQALGLSYAYNSLYKYVKTLIVGKSKYLQNEDVKNRILKRVDAPLICYAYVLFSQSTNYQQLYGIMYTLDNRCEESLERMTNVNL